MSRGEEVGYEPRIPRTKAGNLSLVSFLFKPSKGFDLDMACSNEEYETCFLAALAWEVVVVFEVVVAEACLLT
jgi:hypothetical protein